MSNLIKLMVLFFLLLGVSGCEEGQAPKEIMSKPPPEMQKPMSMGAKGMAPLEEDLETMKDEETGLPVTNWRRGQQETADAPVEGEFMVKFQTTKGDIYLNVDRSWAPLGASRFEQLIIGGYYNGAAFYRVMPTFMVQFGMCGDPEGTAFWDKTFPDEPVLQKNTVGMVSYAKTSAKNSRSTQLFINYENNSSSLDPQGFSPFAKVIAGMDVARAITSKYAQLPSQERMMEEGNEYVFKNFPDIDYIIKASFVKELPEGVVLDDEVGKVKLDDEGKKIVVLDYETVTFPSEDGLEITANLYQAHEDKKKPFIVLCHQAGWSRGEYLEIAPKLNALGFNCVAIDQRSGGKVNDVENATFVAAETAEKGTSFVDAEQDIIAALKWARENHAEGKVILWGSSYSAALALRIGGEHTDLMDGVMSFAPGEYFEKLGKPADWIATSAKKIAAPVFITSAKNEYPNWKPIYFAVPNGAKTKFVPQSKGNHGSRALWDEFKDSIDYWISVKLFLAQFNE